MFPLISLIAVLPAVVWADWCIDTPTSSVIVLRNDRGSFPGPQKGALYITRGNIHARKIFDLNRLPPDALKNARSARIRIYTALYEYSTSKNPNQPSNGLSESIFVRINGKRIIVPTCDPRFSVKNSIQDPLNFRWVSIEFPAAWLDTPNRKLIVETGKMDSLTHDDYYYPAIDRSVSNTSSFVSTNGGRTWTGKWGNIAKDSELMIRLELDRNAGELSEDCAEDFLSVPGASPLKNHGMTAVKNGMLHFRGSPDSELAVPDGEKINLTRNGMTMLCTVRFLDNPAGSAKKNDNMMLFYKDRSFFFGKTGSRFNFSFASGRQGWSEALIGGEVPVNNRWLHLAAVAEVMNDTAQGEVGTRVRIYLNGELHLQKMFRNRYPDRNNAPLLIGAGLPGYELNADLASVAIYNRVLSSAQIAAIAANTPEIDVCPPGSVKVSSALRLRLEHAAKSAADSPEIRWYYNVLLRAAETGFPEERLSILLDEPVPRSLDDLKKKLDSCNCNLKLELNSEAALLIVHGKGRIVSPVLGMLDRKIMRDVFAHRTLEWTLRYRDARRKSAELNSYDQSLEYTVTCSSPGKYTVVWQNRDFTVKSGICFSGGRLDASFSADNRGKKYTLLNVVFPRWQLAKLEGRDTLVYPHMSGILAADPTRTFSMSSLYPSSRVTMQFSGYFNADTGRYFAFEDPLARAKTYQVNGRNGSLSVQWEQAVARDPAAPFGNPAHLDGKAVLEIYRGSWFEAGRLYKQFLASGAKWWIRNIPRTSTPAWFRNNPLNLVMSSAEQTTREALVLRKYYELPFAINWAYWYDMKNPEFPRYLIDKNTAEQLKKMQENGIRIKAYVNPHLWGYSPRTCDGWKTSAAVLNEDGTPCLERYTRDHAVICPASKLGAAWNLRAIVEVAEMGFKGLYHDQLACAFPRLCYSTLHGHPMVGNPADWLENGYWPMYAELRRKLDNVDPEIAQDTEEASDPYLRCVDGYMVWRWTDRNHVPLFQSVYAPRAQFTGRLFDTSPGGSYESFFVKSAEQLVYGEQLGWYHINNLRYASPQRLYSKKLAHIRYGLAERFNRSDMMAPLRFKESPPKLNTVWADVAGAHDTETDQVLSSVWKDSRDGSIMLVFANTTNKTVSVDPFWPYPDSEAVVFRESTPHRSVCSFRKDQSFSLRLVPYETLFVISAPDSMEDAAYASMMVKVASFKDYGPILFHPQNFEICKRIRISEKKPLRPVDSSWRKNAFMPRYQCLAFDAARWIQAVDQAEIFYGKADFGSAPWRGASIELAAETAERGTLVRLFGGEKVLAEWKVADTGKWIRFQTFEEKLKFIPQGDIDLSLRVTGKGCRIKNIRFFLHSRETE